MIPKNKTLQKSPPPLFILNFFSKQVYLLQEIFKILD